MIQGIGLEQRKACIGFSESEMGEVINEKSEDDQSAHHHMT